MTIPFEITGKELKMQEVERIAFDKYTEVRNKLKKQLRDGTLNFKEYSSYQLGVGKRSTGLWLTPGFYLVLNRKTKRILIGQTTNLSERRGDYAKQTSTFPLAIQLSAQVRAEIRAGITVTKDFYFIPLVTIRGGLAPSKIDSVLKNVEDKLLIAIPLAEKELYYNRQGTVFADKIDTAAKPIAFQTYRWESISAAQRYLTYATTTLKSWASLGVMNYPSVETYELFLENAPWEENARQKIVTDLKAAAEAAQTAAEELRNPKPVVIGEKKYPQILESNLYLNSDLMFQRAKLLTLEIINEVDKNTFVYGHYLLKDGSRELSRRLGFYIILNERNKRFYIGSSKILLNRRTRWFNTFKNKDKKRLNENFRAEFPLNFTENDFFFVPFLLYPKNLTISEEDAVDALLEAEDKLVRYYKSIPKYAPRIYNVL